MLVERMKESARTQGVEVVIDAVAESDIADQKPFDIIMLGPQMGHAEGDLAAEYPNIPVTTIDMMDYGMMDGDKVLATALELMEKGLKSWQAAQNGEPRSRKSARKSKKHLYQRYFQRSDGLDANIDSGRYFFLINALKLDPYQNFLESTGLKTYTSIPATVTTDLIALYAVFSIAYNFATQHKQQGFSAGILALMSFLLVTPKGLLDDGVTKAFGYSWLGAKGLFVAIILALLVGKIYTFVLEKKFYIKMPKGVPPTVEKSFAALTPGFIVAVLMLVLTAIFAATKYGNMHEFVFSIIQLPLTSLGVPGGRC